MEAADFSGEIVTFWFTDIERSTRLLQELGHDAYTSVLEEHNRIITEIVGPSLVSTEGDSFFSVFRSPTEAVRAAAETQRRIEAKRWPENGRVRVRIGMHSGPARRGGSDFVGLDVHRAARVSAAGHGGQVLLTATTRTLVESDLPEGTALADLGEHHLKDLLKPEHLFQLSVDGLQQSFPPVVSQGGGEVRLPEPATAFVGREADLVTVAEALEGARLVTLVGIGGVGKTRLALQAVRVADLSRERNVFFVNLADIGDEGSVAKAAAKALALSEQAGRLVEETLVDYLADRSDLLLFDNCEHVIEGAAHLIDQILRRCPAVSVLATSREPLMIAAEKVVNVSPMATTSEGDAPGDSVRLFEIRAQAVSNDFELADWRTDVEAICSRVDGIPLAIELAAARVAVLTPSEILEHLEDRFSLLSTHRRGGDPRHQTLEATLDWSYELLEADHRDLLASLSVFRGGFTADAVEQICFDDGTGSPLVIESLTILHERSLLQRTVESGRSRFHLLETVQEYASRKLADSELHDRVMKRHREYFSEFAREQASRLGGSDQLEALDLLEADHNNMRAVMDRAASSAEWEVAADLAGRLSWFWYVHGHFKEGERRAETLLEKLPDRPGRRWLRLLIASAQFDYRLAFFERAEKKLRQAVDLAKSSGDMRLEMWARAYAATNAVYQLDLDAGKEHAARALELAEKEGDLLAYGYARMIEIGGDAAAFEFRGELTPERASELRAELEPMSALAQNLEERNIVGHMMEVEGLLSFRSGDALAAAIALDRSIVALTELGTIACGCHCLEAIALCSAESGMVDSAVRLLGASDGLREMVGISVSPMEMPFRAGTMKLAEETLDAAQVRELQASAFGYSSQEAMQLARDAVADLAG